LACREIVFAALREHGIPPEPEGRDRGIFGFGGRPGRFRDLVAETREPPTRVVGVAALEPWDDKGFVSSLFVRPEARGRGVGRALLGATCDVARELGMRELWLTTRPVFTRAIALYEAFGFVRVDDPSGAFQGDLAYRLVVPSALAGG
jgi:ribosomal protein S18 acetylase RimI-like enzyme